MRKMLLVAVAVMLGLFTLTAFDAAAAPTVGIGVKAAGGIATNVDYRSNGRHWHHRSYHHRHWHYWN
jgi:hypothetical protein